METFAKFWQRFRVLAYHCFDRIIIRATLVLLTDSRPEHFVHFFRKRTRQYPITSQDQPTPR